MSDLRGVPKFGKIPVKFEPLAFLEKWKDLVPSDFCMGTTGWRTGLRAREIRGYLGRRDTRRRGYGLAFQGFPPGWMHEFLARVWALRSLELVTLVSSY